MQSKTRNTKSSKRLTQLQSSHTSSHNSTLDRLQFLKPIRQSQHLKCTIHQDNKENGQKHNFHQATNQSQSQQQQQQQIQQEQQQEQTSTQKLKCYLDQYKSAVSEESDKHFFSKQIQQQLRRLRDEINEVVCTRKELDEQQMQQKQKSAKKQSMNSTINYSNGVNLYVVNKKRSNQKKNADILDTLKESQHSRTQRVNSNVRSGNDVKSKPRKDESACKYSGVKSKVRSNLRSKTPKIKSIQNQLPHDHSEKVIQRQEEIIQLENQVQQIQHDLEFKATNHEYILESYKNQQQPHEVQVNFQSQRKGTDPVFSDQGNNELQDSTDESTKNKLNLNSKKEFSDLDLQLRSVEISGINKVYLELCGFTDLDASKQQLIEIHNERKRFGNQFSNPLSPKSKEQVQIINDDLHGTATFYEKRRSKNHSRQQSKFKSPVKSQRSKSRSPVKQSKSPMRTQPSPFKQGNSRPVSSLTKYDDSPTQIRKIEDHEREDFMEPYLIHMESEFALENDELRKKREELRLQSEKMAQDFDQVLDELVAQRKTASHLAFYEAINEYHYDKKQLDNAHFKDSDGNFIQAHSPTKRLICMKNAAIQHLKEIKDRNLINNQNPNSMVYMASPERSYVVKCDTKIDYNLAFKKNPSKFYDQALTAPIVKHKIKQQRESVSPKNSGLSDRKTTLGSSISSQTFRQAANTTNKKNKKKRDHEVYTIVSKKTTRPHNRINQKIKDKIEQKLADKLGTQLTQQVLKALEEANLQEAIADLISLESGSIKDEYQGQRIAKAMSTQELPLTHQFDEEEPLIKPQNVHENPHSNISEKPNSSLTQREVDRDDKVQVYKRSQSRQKVGSLSQRSGRKSRQMACEQ